MSSSVRQRAPKSSDAAPSSSSPNARVKAEDSYNILSPIEIGRIITLLFFASCVTSWFVTNEDIFWGHRPPYTKVSFWQDLLRGPLNLTPTQLARYDGTDPSLPLLLSINGTIYDVSKGRHFYGPGGSYSSFGGADGTRAFVTGCFKDDITPDLRGAELMFLPVDDPEIDALYSSGELKKLKEQERRFAKTQVENSVKHWVDFFANSPKYTKVGELKWKPGKGDEKLRPLCKKAQDGRLKRQIPGEGEAGKGH